MIFSFEASKIVQTMGLDPEDIDRYPIDADHRAKLDEALFGRSGMPEPPVDLIVRILDKERSEGWHIYQPGEIYVAVPDEQSLCRFLTNRYKSLLLLVHELFGARNAPPTPFEAKFVCVPSSRQDAYVYEHDGAEYIVLSYGLVALMRFCGESLLLTRWFQMEAFRGAETAMIESFWDQIRRREPFVAQLAQRRHDVLPWIGAALSNYEYLDSCCCLGFALYFVCTHESVHMAQNHSRLLDPLHTAYSDSSSVKRFCKAYSITAHQALELVADEQATYYADAIDGWSNLSFGIAAYILATGLGNSGDIEKLRLAYARADSLASQHLGEGGPSAFGIGAVVISEVARLFKELIDSFKRPERTATRAGIDEATAWSQFINDFYRLAKYLRAKVGITYSKPLAERTAVLKVIAEPAASPKPVTLTVHDGETDQRLNASPDQMRAMIELVRANLASDPHAARPLLGALLSEFAQSISASDHPYDALEPAKEAVSIFRGLAETDPQFRLMLALSLTTVGLVFDRITHYERAAGIYERKKIDIFRQDRLTLRAGLDEGNLESALSSMANDLMLLSGGEERLGCNEEAALILRELDALEPTKYTEELAGTLLNLANNLRDLGRLSAARETIGEAISALHSVPEPGSNTLYKMAMMLIADADICAKDDQCSPDVGIASAQEALDILSFISGNLEDAFAEERKAATLALSELSKRKPA